jgi:hypothetical protein
MTNNLGDSVYGYINKTDGKVYLYNTKEERDAVLKKKKKVNKMTNLDKLGKSFLAIYDTIPNDIWVVIWTIGMLTGEGE